MPAASWRRPEAETKARSSRRKRYGLLGASGWCSTGAAELQEQRAHDQFAGAGRRRPDLWRRRRSVLGEESRLRARERKRESVNGLPGFKKARRFFSSSRGSRRWRGGARCLACAATPRHGFSGGENDGADRWDPPVSGSAEAVRSDSARVG